MNPYQPPKISSDSNQSFEISESKAYALALAYLLSTPLLCNLIIFRLLPVLKDLQDSPITYLVFPALVCLTIYISLCATFIKRDFLLDAKVVLGCYALGVISIVVARLIVGDYLTNLGPLLQIR